MAPAGLSDPLSPDGIRSVWIVEGDYGRGYEVLTAEDSLTDAHMQLGAFRLEEQPYVAVDLRIRKVDDGQVTS